MNILNIGKLKGIKRYPSAALLSIQVLSLILHLFMDSSIFNQALFSCFNVAVILLAVRVVSISPAVTRPIYILAAPAVILSLLSVFFQSPSILISSQIIESLTYGYTAYALILYMFNDDTITTDELFAAAATFTLLAWAFALIYSVLQTLSPGAITGPGDGLRSWIELLFLSFSILSSTGYGDIMLASPGARVIGTVQMFFGLMYMAIIVSRLISMSNANKTK